MLLKDKYNPYFFEEFIIHKKIVSRLKVLSQYSDLLNIVLYGPEGTGKYTIAKNILSNLYGKDIYKTKEYTISVKNSNNTKEFTILQSNYHFEIGINKYIFNDKNSLSNVLDKLSSNRNIINKYNIILIRNIDYLSTESLTFFKRKLETIYNNCSFILTCHSISSFCNILKSRFTYVRVPLPESVELIDFLNIIKKKESINVTNTNIKDIVKISKNSIPKSLFILEYSLINGKYLKYVDPIKIEIKNLVKLIFSTNVHMIPKIREGLYSLTVKNIDTNFILKEILKISLKSKCNNKCKQEIISLMASFSHKKCESYKELVHVEALLINIMYVIDVNN